MRTPPRRSAEDYPPTGPAGVPALDSDLGWALGTVFRRYLRASREAVAEVPGGPRGYQVLAAAAGELTGTQLALANQLGIDRTVMTYLLDDLEGAGLVERRPDPADRRARRVSATELGHARLSELHARLREAEEDVLAALDEPARDTFRALLQRVATHAQALDPTASPCQVATDVAKEVGAAGDLTGDAC